MNGPFDCEEEGGAEWGEAPVVCEVGFGEAEVEERVFD